MGMLDFTSSGFLTLGVELELQLVSTGDFDLVPGGSDLVRLLGKRAFPGTVSLEMTEGMIEIASGVHAGYEPLRAELESIAEHLVGAADRLNLGICGGGTHPFQQWSEQKVSPRPRFRELSHLYGYLAKQFTIFGQHVHVGCPDGDLALRLLHRLNRFVPHFIALAASSPCVQGHDTRFDSARLNSVFAFPLSGRAPLCDSWDDFCSGYFSRMQATGVVHSMKDFYWDIRPKPEYGTIELRVCDTPLQVGRAAALAAYLQSICRYLLMEGARSVSEDQYLVYTYNRFQACRFGLGAVVVDPYGYGQVVLRDDILDTLDTVAEHADALGAGAALGEVRRICEEGNDARLLRAELEAEGSVEAMVDLAVERFRQPL